MGQNSKVEVRHIVSIFMLMSVCKQSNIYHMHKSHPSQTSAETSGAYARGKNRTTQKERIKQGDRNPLQP